MSRMPPRPIWRKLSAGLPVAAPPVQYSTRAEQREHHAEGHDEATAPSGTSTMRPLTRPTTTPNDEHEDEHGHGARLVLPDEVAGDDHLGGDERAHARGRTRRATITKYWPIATIAIGATRWTKRMS